MKPLKEGVNLFGIEVIIKTDFKYNKVEIYNQIRALKGVVVCKIENNSYLSSRSTEQFEFTLVHIKFTSTTEPLKDIELIKQDALHTNKVLGLLQFITRPATLVRKAQY